MTRDFLIFIIKNNFLPFPKSFLYKSKCFIAGIVTIVIKFNLVIVKIWSVSQHGKCECDNAGGSAFKSIVYYQKLTGNLKVTEFEDAVNCVYEAESTVIKDFYIIQKQYHNKIIKFHNNIRNDKNITLPGIRNWQMAVIDPDNINKKKLTAKIKFKNIFDIESEWTEIGMKLKSSLLNTTKFELIEKYDGAQKVCEED